MEGCGEAVSWHSMGLLARALLVRLPGTKAEEMHGVVGARCFCVGRDERSQGAGCGERSEG